MLDAGSGTAASRRTEVELALAKRSQLARDVVGVLAAAAEVLMASTGSRSVRTWLRGADEATFAAGPSFGPGADATDPPDLGAFEPSPMAGRTGGDVAARPTPVRSAGGTAWACPVTVDGRVACVLELDTGATPSPDDAAELLGFVAERIAAPLARVLPESVQSAELAFADLPLPAWVFDATTLAFLAVNEAAVAAYGWSRDAFLSMTLADIRPPEDVAALRAHVAASRPPTDVGEPWRHRTRDGTLRHVRVHSRAITYEGRIARLAIVQDVTSETEQASAYRELAAFGSEIELVHDIDALVDLGLRRLTGILGMDVAAFYDVRADEVVASRMFGFPDGPGAAVLAQPRRLGQGVVGWVARNGRVAFDDDYPSSRLAMPTMVALGLRSQITLPVRTGGEVRHVVSVGSLQRPTRLGETALYVAQAFVRRLENALERVRVLDDVRATREATFRAFGVALEHRSYETKGHTDRVARLALRLGRVVGLAPDELQELQWGAYLHDIGKIAISDAILLKPARLTAEEFEAVKAHTVVGDQMLADQAFLPAASRAVVRHHHERWNGGGYPDGLAGEAIPLGARLFAFADVYDALTSERPYKEIWPVDRAVAEIRAGGGTHFDPSLVDPFVETVLGHRD